MTDLTRWTPFEIRWWSRIEVTDGCWLWTGKLDPKGYACRIGYEKGYVRPHRLAYELSVGPIPEGLVIDHLCRNRACVNPRHLEPVTPEENTRRGVLARWSEPCPAGHDPSHRRSLPSGKNICSECRRISDRARHQRDGERRRAAARARYARQRAA